ncbi:hypothetical protein MBUL_01652 [Methylobacterium bullatum]|uniref:Uncharacterized protein n=1 Tax=Methylobacterium bullatum TaxID=570505 RepID=A0A679IYS8_9HYPH|nr:hypothetical protein MBUL_01652 [Methylobacterium bullatum]
MRRILNPPSGRRRNGKAPTWRRGSASLSNWTELMAGERPAAVRVRRAEPNGEVRDGALYACATRPAFSQRERSVRGPSNSGPSEAPCLSREDGLARMEQPRLASAYRTRIGSNGKRRLPSRQNLSGKLKRLPCLQLREPAFLRHACDTANSDGTGGVNSRRGDAGRCSTGGAEVLDQGIEVGAHGLDLRLRHIELAHHRFPHEAGLGAKVTAMLGQLDFDLALVTPPSVAD